MDDPKATDAGPADRRERFEADLAEIQVRTGAAASEPKLVALGIALMVAGIVLAILAFVISGGQADTRDVLSTMILGLIGVSITVAGAVVFLRYSLGRFFRAWLLRLIYEQQSGT